ncbi:MAG: hypothetical protein NUW37_02280 [Planctomycetes bacterium]|nr:hypothetical protein [Planctomycetota bacterium]
MSLLLASELLRDPFLRGFRMPVSYEEQARMFVWQAWILPDPGRPGDPQIAFELHHMELVQTADLNGLDEPFTSFLERGCVDYGPAIGPKNFIDASSSEMDKHVPVTFSLQPLFRVDDIDKPNQLRRKIEAVEKRRHHSPDRLVLQWSDVQKALNQEAVHVVPFRGNIEEARWYQTLTREDGRELVVARLPDAKNERLFGTQPDRMFVNRRHYLDEGGAIVRLTPQVVENLLDVVPRMIDDLDLLAKTYYTRPKREPRDPFAQAESMFEELVEELRFAIASKALDEASLQTLLIDSGGELLEELRRVVLASVSESPSEEGDTDSDEQDSDD